MTWLICMLTTPCINNTWCTCQSCPSCSSTIITCSSTIRISNSLPRQLWATPSCIPRLSTTSIENKFLGATFSMSMFKCVQMNLSPRENISWRVKTWKNGSGTQLIFKKPSSDVTDNHSRMMPVISLIQSFCSKISSEDTLMILLWNHSLLEKIWLVSDRIIKPFQKSNTYLPI